MLVSVFLALLLPCAGMSVVFVVYICMLWYATGGNNNIPSREPEKPVKEKGLSVSDLEKLPKVVGKELMLGSECAVCLDEIGSEQAVRVMVGCNHAFHVECADTWLSKHSVCPLCRSKLVAVLSGDPCESPC